MRVRSDLCSGKATTSGMRRRLFPKATDLDVSVGEGTHSRRLGTDSENDAFHLLRPAQTRRHKEINFGTRRDPGKAGDGYVDEMEMQSCQTIGEESKSPDISGAVSCYTNPPHPMYVG